MGHCLTHWRIKLGAQGALKVHGRSTVTIWRSFFKFFSLKRFFFPLFHSLMELFHSPSHCIGVWETSQMHRRDSGLGCRQAQISILSCCPHITTAGSRKLFVWGACVQLGPGQVSANADVQCTFLPLFTNRWCQRESLSCPKPPGHSSCISF